MSKTQATAPNLLPPPAIVLKAQAGRMPERLVGIGFRCWFAGLNSGDITAWEDAWNAFADTLGVQSAKGLLIDLSHFVRAIKTTADREIEIYPTGCLGFCRDECLVISMIAACQHGARPALQASATALIGSSDIGDALSGAHVFATGMKAANQVLNPNSICPATCALHTDRRRLM